MSSLPRTTSLIHDGIDLGLHIGAQVAVSLCGESVADLAIGDARSGVPMRTDTLMPWLSCTKPLGAIIAARLLESGDLALDDPVTARIPEFGQNGKGAVTLRHLLTHTGGFRDAAFNWLEDDWETILDAICRAPLEAGWAPGQKAGYHKETSWYVLAEIVQRTTGRAFSNVVREDLFVPLGMEDSWIVLDPERHDLYGPRIGVLHDTASGKPVAHLGWDDEDGAATCRPGGGGRGPANELLRVYEMLLAGGARQDKVILQPESVRLLTSRQREGLFDDTFRHKVDWGLGFIVNSNRYGARTVPYGFGLHASDDAFGHGGQQSSVSFADPEHDLAGVVILNGTPGEPKHNRRIRHLLTALYEDLGLA